MELLGDIARRVLVNAHKQAENRARVTRHEAKAAMTTALTSKSYRELNACEDVMCNHQIAMGAEFKARKALSDHDEKPR